MNNENIEQLFHGRTEFAIIGMTGRTGSGCTTAASMLENEAIEYPTYHDTKVNGTAFYKDLNGKRYNIVKKYAEHNRTGFYSIKISDVISAFLLRLNEGDLVNFIFEHQRETVRADREQIKECIVKALISRNRLISQYGDIQKHFTNTEETTPDFDREYFQGFMLSIRAFNGLLKRRLKSLDASLYVSVYQAAGDSIRKVGKLTPDYISKDVIPSAIFLLPETVNNIIKIIRQLNKASDQRTFIVIDAIRNPQEARFFKDRYSAFYLMSVNAPDKDRKEYLKVVHKFTEDQLIELDKKESGKSLEDKKLSKKEKKEAAWIGQDVKKCIEMSDIHIFNPRNELRNNNVLKAQLAWYTSLIKHPGLVSPTSMERVMQIAYTAKANSGCISRQVGAVVTDENSSIKAVGWNDVAEGQYPCSLRSAEGLLNEFDPEIYSEYERNNDDFRKHIDKKYGALIAKSTALEGRNLAYCFKDAKNNISDERNQVHTRSLHAEENAFLQIAKYGGQGIQGGKLYTTASPCELCAKKAYQLGIREVIYIDPYPGIAREHIISIGNNPPELVQFRGAVGKAYHLLYEPVMSYKDELDYFLD
ncbi:dCMP deaminase [Sinobacterium caligoides]|uniref:dCMP deaminase n=1 Tax=Sinobacterium caligoides TaxID=933926 RepID=A0A3N2DK73_9GAMM|nr:anti-phage dCTP deaminase [Sinobacterium caligoides]ROS00211.1 dCMP deaminase [Sinobacterium caligoides]